MSIIRLWIFAALAEPIYQGYFHEAGNALIPLALGVTFLFVGEVGDRFKRAVLTSLVMVLAVALMFVTKSYSMVTVSALVWFFHRYQITRHVGWIAPAVVAAALCNRIALPESGMLIFTFSLIHVCALGLLVLPRVRLSKWVGYLFYPAHLAVLWVVLGV